jgi:hypothetical protein
MGASPNGVLLIAVLATAAVTVAIVFVLIEMVRQVADIRERLNIDDAPIPQPLGASVGQPLPPSVAAHIGASTGDLLLVFLTTDCSTCRMVGRGIPEADAALGGGLRIIPIIQTHRASDAVEFCAEVGIRLDRVVVDERAEVGRELDIRIRPLAVAALRGSITEAASVRNDRQLVAFASRISASIRTRSRYGEKAAAGATALA